MLNQKLHKLLIENETNMYATSQGIEFGVHVYHFDLDELVTILGDEYLSEGLDCTITNSNTIYVPLKDYFRYNEYFLIDYRDCFYEGDLNTYALEIYEFDME